jgi:hypothetical protein
MDGPEHTRARAAATMETFDDDVLIVRRSGLVLAAAAAPAALGVALACMRQPTAVALGSAVAWLGTGVLLYAWTRNPGAPERPSRAHADARGLWLDGALRLEASRIRGGWVQPRRLAPPLVHVCAHGARDVELVVRDVERGRALLRALEVDPTRASAHYWVLARPLGEPRSFARAATLIALVLAFGVVAGQTVPAALALAVVASFVVFAGVAWPMHVTVGADGVHLRWLGTGRFVAWSSIAAIEVYDGGVVLALEGGQWLTLRVPADHERHHPERDAMVERMRVAWRAHVSACADDTSARLVRPSGGHTREWVRAMRAMVHAERGYRVAAVPPERLWRIVEDPRADRAARTGAALALAPSLDEAGRGRLRAAASACAEPRLRIALSTAASDTGAHASDDELAAALDAIEAEGENDERIARTP